MTELQSIEAKHSLWAASAPKGGGRALKIAAEAYGVPLEEVTAATRRGPRAALARQVAMYLAHVVLGMTMSEIAHAFGRDRTTASHACRRIEDLRENAQFDRSIAWLEAKLAAGEMP